MAITNTRTLLCTSIPTGVGSAGEDQNTKETEIEALSPNDLQVTTSRKKENFQ